MKVKEDIGFKKDKGITGKVLVELFEGDKKIKEVYTENIVPDVIFKDIYLRYFSGEVLGIGNSSHGSTANLFNNIYLTDSIKPESPNSERVLGNIIGYAHRGQTYSGSDPLRGTVNLAETKVEIRNNKVRVNFVFDFPTHAANGTFESIFWGDDFNNLDSCYEGPPLHLRSKTSNTGRGRLYMASNTTDEELRAGRWGYLYLLGGHPAKFRVFLSYHTGYVYFDGTSSSAYNSNLIQFPEHLKNHQLILPFNLNNLSTGFVNWTEAITLLNDQGNPFNSNELTGAFPVLKENGEIDYIFGYWIRTVGSGSSTRRVLTIYRWTRVGVLQNSVTIDNSEQTFQDEYGTNFVYLDLAVTPVLWGGQIEIYGYYFRTDPATNETIYTNRLIRINQDGTYHSELNLRPRISSSTWFETRGMHSGNIDRRCRLSSLPARTRNRIYLFYTGMNGGSSFYQVITPEGNIIEPYRSQGISSEYHNIRGTDKWLYLYRYSDSSSNYTLGLNYAATSRPCGAHTKLPQPVEKTETNTMKIQYMFEIN